MVRIRAGEPPDALAVAALHLQLGREQGHRAEPGFLDRCAGAWRAGADHRRTWLAVEVDGRPVGVTVVEVVAELPRPGRPDLVRWHVSSLFVTPDARGQGLGERLLRAVVQAARGEAVDRVQQREPSQATALYERVGFTAADERLLELRL